MNRFIIVAALCALALVPCAPPLPSGAAVPPHCIGCDFGHADLHGQSFEGVSYVGADIAGANLRGDEFFVDDIHANGFNRNRRCALRGEIRIIGVRDVERDRAAGEKIVAGAIRGVAYGVVGTAVIQAVLLAIGLAVAGVPGAAMLGFVGLLLAISQIGGPLIILIWGGAAWWLFGQDHQAWGAFMIIWGVFVNTVDNFIKPWLIGFGIEMPMSLTILGVFGGFIAFGFLGLFIGPTLIAIMFTFLQAWRAAVSSPPAIDVLKSVA